MNHITVPGSHAEAVLVKANHTVEVVNTHGTQVVDFWAVRAGRPEIAISMQHSRVRWLNMRPHPGDSILDDERSTVMTLLADTSPGVHDTLIAACDPHRYAQLGAAPGHRSCAVNFAEALATHNITRSAHVPAPLNLFMNIPWDPSGNLVFLPTVSAPGDSVTFRAEVDLFVVASACPMDIVPINGPGGGVPVDFELVVD